MAVAATKAGKRVSGVYVMSGIVFASVVEGVDAPRALLRAHVYRREEGLRGRRRGVVRARGGTYEWRTSRLLVSPCFEHHAGFVSRRVEGREGCSRRGMGDTSLGMRAH